MEITYLGLSCVRLRGREAQVVVDPPDGQLPGLGRLTPDLIVRTEGRTDPDKLRPREGQSQEVAGAGEFEVRGVTVRGVDLGNGRTVMRVEIDDVRVVSVGRLDRQLDEEEIDALGHIDVLVAPVGGGDALAPSAATKLVNALTPAIVIPVRYRSPASPGSGEYEPVDTFAKEMGLADDAYQALPKLSLNGAMTGSDDSRVVVLEPRGVG
ncbi:MAG TPA: MBL fold metallo-hydrolase [Candidatus Dormibacteraeota bacterium]|jgi:L-ascorbate metabolism protein UlaG (beta-lactamase superfamily)|nr:MBL fold metallo-hydrolase [Candidatus Dormibacteraeota bacterium]